MRKDMAKVFFILTAVVATVFGFPAENSAGYFGARSARAASPGHDYYHHDHHHDFDHHHDHDRDFHYGHDIHDHHHHDHDRHEGFGHDHHPHGGFGFEHHDHHADRFRRDANLEPPYFGRHRPEHFDGLRGTDFGVPYDTYSPFAPESYEGFNHRDGLQPYGQYPGHQKSYSQSSSSAGSISTPFGAESYSSSNSGSSGGFF